MLCRKKLEFIYSKLGLYDIYALVRKGVLEKYIIVIILYGVFWSLYSMLQYIYMHERRKGYVKTELFLSFLFMQTLNPSNKNKFLKLSGNEIKR
jgi:hypothetical protein